MDPTTGPDRAIAIIGAGFSGTMTALHLLSRTTTRPILLCERGAHFARGMAYGTEDPGHLLNVRASNMSAFPHKSHDFVRWLDAAGLRNSPQVRTTPAGIFVSRHLYGTYLTTLLGEAVSDREGAARLILVPDEVVDLVPDEDGFRLVLAGGRQHAVAGVVLAAGHALAAGSGSGPYVANPWAGPSFAEGLSGSDPVVVVGSGLTMVDVTLQLRHAGFTGPVVAISRRGLLPHTHVATPPWPTPVLSAEERTSPSRLLRRLRQEADAAQAAGIPWQSVVDSVRPITTALWQSLDEVAQQRFLRHARPWWDIHRHRMALPVGLAIAALVRDGDLDVRAGQIVAVTTAGDHAQVTYRPRSQAATVVIDAQRVINATGAAGPDQGGNPLLEQMIERGLARPDCHGLGLDVTTEFALRGRSGAAVPGLWAVGPLGVAAFWECTAVPDIRSQAVLVADHVAATLPG